LKELCGLLTEYALLRALYFAVFIGLVLVLIISSSSVSFLPITRAVLAYFLSKFKQNPSKPFPFFDGSLY
jgi:hypothetical protein